MMHDNKRNMVTLTAMTYTLWVQMHIVSFNLPAHYFDEVLVQTLYLSEHPFQWNYFVLETF